MFPYSRLAWYGIWLGRLSVPSIVTPSFATTWPGSVTSTLPPVSAAMSTITEPGFIARTISALTSFGAGRPGTAAVVIRMSAAATRSASSSCWRRCTSAETSFAYSPEPEPSPSCCTSICTNFAPKLSTSSLTAGRTS